MIFFISRHFIKERKEVRREEKEGEKEEKKKFYLN